MASGCSSWLWTRYARGCRTRNGLRCTVTLLVAAVMLAFVRIRPAVPIALIAVIAATLVVQAFDIDIATIGSLPSSLRAPSLPSFAGIHVGSLVMPAIAVAAFAALEGLLSATVADAMTVSQRHDPDRELFGQGIANLAVPMFGGIPATAAIARTAVNVRSGAHSRLAAITHAAVLLLVVLALAPFVAEDPAGGVRRCTARDRGTHGRGVQSARTAALDAQ